MSGTLCADAYSNAATSYYLKNGPIVAPTLVSPVTVKSADGTKTGTITETNIGQMVIQSGFGDITVYPGTGNMYLLSADSNSSVQLSMANGGPFTIAPAGNTVIIGDDTSSTGALLEVNGASGVGRVYDDVYNKPPSGPSVNASTYTSPEIPVNTNVLIGTGTLAAGLYMLQAKVNIQTALTAGTSINVYVEDSPPAGTAATYLPFSSIVIAPGTLAAPISPDPSIDATFTSAFFTIPAGLTNLKYFVEVAGSWNFGSEGNMQLQLVKIA